MRLKDLIGKTVSGVTEPWDGECEGDEARLKFSDGTEIQVMAVDHSEPPCGSPSISIEIRH